MDYEDTPSDPNHPLHLELMEYQDESFAIRMSEWAHFLRSHGVSKADFIGGLIASETSSGPRSMQHDWGQPFDDDTIPH